MYTAYTYTSTHGHRPALLKYLKSTIEFDSCAIGV